MTEGKDPMGHAIADFHATGKAARLRVFSPMFDEDEIPVTTLFRSFADMPAIEQEALKAASGAILDVGAGSGCHSLALQDMGNHYGFTVLPCDPGEPTQKALVEDAVRITYNRIYCSCRNNHNHRNSRT